MALNTWWAGDPSQRYWMEITNRDVLGENLLAPQLDAAGHEHPTYALVSHVQPGDRVLHYLTDATGGAAIVGWSEAVGPPSTGTMTWLPRGAGNRGSIAPTTGPSWFVPLGGFHEFDDAVRGSDLAGRSVEALRLRDELTAKHRKPLYFPFFEYRPGQIRAYQGYLVKFPAELLALLPDLADAASDSRAGDTGDVEEEAAPKRAVPRGTVTRIQDPELRRAIENHAVGQAIEHYTRLGCTECKILGKPYDISVVVNGQERHVEVKGSSLTIETVELTINEIIHAEDFQPTDLVVVDGIDVSRTKGGKIVTAGGRFRIWPDWIPGEEDLSGRKFAYVLPPSDQGRAGAGG